MGDAAIAEYGAAVKLGATYPPMIVYFDGVKFWLTDGFHCFRAYRTACVDEVAAPVGGLLHLLSFLRWAK